jgi:pSer/pThr/pTyr-binding forkhead associated (FHA) protein
MPLTVIVRTNSGSESRLTFDGTQRIVLGRGAGCDVRLPDATVSVRHASLRAQGFEFVLVDEGSSNGTFVGDVRVAARTSRIIRSGERARLGRVWIELRIDQGPITRDLAVATRDLALAFVAEALDAMGSDPTMQLIVVEGADQGAAVALVEEERPYVVGRGAECDLPLADVDASREHASFVRRGHSVYVRDLGAKNGTWIGETRVPDDREVPWRPTQMVQIGRTVLALREPISEALARIEGVPDEPMAEGDPMAPPALPQPEPAPPSDMPLPSAAPVTVVPARAEPARAQRARWSRVDLVVMAVALSVLAVSVAGLVWLLRS